MARNIIWSRSQIHASKAYSLLVIVAVFLAFSAERVGALTTGVKTNIVLILADDLGYGDVEYNSVNPAVGVKTPQLNAMAAANGVLRMDNFHAPSTTCSPTRASLLSGRYPERECVAGINPPGYRLNLRYRDAFPFRPDMASIAKNARLAGYSTAFFGKWHIGPIPERSPGTMGFTHWAATLSNIPTYDPFCADMHISCYKDCNAPFDCFRSTLTQVRGCSSRMAAQKCHLGHNPSVDAVANVVPFEPTAARIKNSEPQRHLTAADILVNRFDTFVKGTAADIPIFAYLFFYEVHEPLIASPNLAEACMNATICKRPYSSISEEVDYYGALYAFDMAIGRIRNILKQVGRSENTLLIITSDNGPAMGVGSSGRYAGVKRGVREGSHRVPTLFEWPAVVKENQVVNALTSGLDLYPTFMDIMLAENPSLDFSSLKARPTDGESLLPLITMANRGDWQRARGFGICESLLRKGLRYCPNWVYLKDNWRLSSFRQADKRRYVAANMQLFDIEADPLEVSNRVQSNRTVFQSLLGEALSWIASTEFQYGRHCTARR